MFNLKLENKTIQAIIKIMTDKPIVAIHVVRNLETTLEFAYAGISYSVKTMGHLYLVRARIVGNYLTAYNGTITPGDPLYVPMNSAFLKLTENFQEPPDTMQEIIQKSAEK